MGRFFTKPAETARAGCSAGRAGRIHPHGESVKKACHCEEGKARRGDQFLKLTSISIFPTFGLRIPTSLRSRWQLCCLTDAAYPLRVLRRAT